MKKILLMDTLSTIHVGNGALTENTIKLIKRVYPDADISILSLDVETCSLRHDDVYEVLFNKGVIKEGKISKAVWFIRQILFIFLSFVNIYFPFVKMHCLFASSKQKETMKEIEKADICISLSGEGINDIFYKSLPFWLFTYWLAIAKGKTFIQFPQSIGPLQNKWNRFIVYQALKNAHILVGRDEKSYALLKTLKFKEEKILYISDVAIHQDILENVNVHQYFKNQKKKILGVTVSKIPGEIKFKTDYIDQIYQSVINTLDENDYKILLMPTNIIINGISPDYQLSLELRDKFLGQYETAILENRPYFPDEYKALQAQLEFFISTRMHACILATSGYTPTLAINTQHKIRGYMENIAMGEYCVDMNELDILGTRIKKLLLNKKAITHDLKYQINILKKQHDVLIDKIREL